MAGKGKESRARNQNYNNPSEASEQQPSTDSVTPSFQDTASAGELKGDGGTNPDSLRSSGHVAKRSPDFLSGTVNLPTLPLFPKPLFIKATFPEY